VKKLISIGVALALLAMVVLPVGVAADIQPTSYAKIPFAIIGSFFEMVGDILGMADPILVAMNVSLPLNMGDLVPIVKTVANWTAGPLAWSVDMLAWGVALFADIYGTVDKMFGIGYTNLTLILDTMACGLRTCWEGGCLNITCFNCT
jgi:hypothetical protein